MSSHPTRYVRRKDDAYFTPGKVSRFMVEMAMARGFVKDGMRVLEPSAGKGSFVKSLELALYLKELIAVEPNPDSQYEMFANEQTQQAICTLEEFHSHGVGRFDFIIGNPPFSLALEHVRLCLDMLKDGGRLMFLLRLAFLETRKRYPFWEEHPPSHVFPLAERISFTEDGKADSAAYAVFVWTKGHRGPAQLSVASWDS